jgi:hypothetical protein
VVNVDWQLVNVQVCALLLTHGANVALTNKAGDTATSLARKHDKPKVLRVLGA